MLVRASLCICYDAEGFMGRSHFFWNEAAFETSILSFGTSDSVLLGKPISNGLRADGPTLDH